MGQFSFEAGPFVWWGCPVESTYPTVQSSGLANPKKSPAGAVFAETEFSVQSVPSCELDCGDPRAFRFFEVINPDAVADLHRAERVSCPKIGCSLCDRRRQSVHGHHGGIVPPTVLK
jgi:hypothetical protein